MLSLSSQIDINKNPISDTEILLGKYISISISIKNCDVS